MGVNEVGKTNCEGMVHRERCFDRFLGQIDADPGASVAYPDQRYLPLFCC